MRQNCTNIEIDLTLDVACLGLTDILDSSIENNNNITKMIFASIFLRIFTWKILCQPKKVQITVWYFNHIKSLCLGRRKSFNPLKIQSKVFFSKSYVNIHLTFGALSCFNHIYHCIDYFINAKRNDSSLDLVYQILI